jgi:hypothetical protein
MIDFGMVRCLCDRCDCCEECEFFEQSVKPVVEAVNANYDPMDRYMRSLVDVLCNFQCDYFEPKN